jgi:nucleoside-diphosphate-sugar epimerase
MIVITGPTSFIGRKVVPSLLKYFKKPEILCLCWNKDGEIGIQNRKQLEKIQLPIAFADLVTKEGLKTIPKSSDVVIHMAANTNSSSSDHKVNDIGTKNLIKSLGKLGPKTHIIFTSTTTFLGGRSNCTLPLNEDSPEFPTNEYGRSKLRAEKYLITECIKQKFRLTILRLNTVYGPGSRPKSMFKLLPEQIKKGLFLTRLNWPGLTSIVYIDDVAKAIIYFTRNAIPKPGIPQTFILSGESLTMADIYKTMYKALGILYKPVYLPAITWQFAKIARNIIPLLEPLLPQILYSPFWRASLIIDNAVWCETNKISGAMPNWNPNKLSSVAKNIV